MARISYERGVKCKHCGRIRLNINRYDRYILCQGCGAHLLTYLGNQEVEIADENAKMITVKVTHKLFSETYEEV